jgi:hypothetical protein
MKKFVKFSMAISLSFALVGIANAQSNELVSALREALQFEFNFNENVADESGNGLLATLQGAALAQDANKTLGRSCGFNASEDGKMVVLHNPNLNPTTMTLATWVFGGSALAGPASIIYKMDSAAKAGYALRRNENNDAFVWEFYDTQGTLHTVESTTKIGKGQWHYVTAVFDGLRSKLYIDGKLEGEQLAAGNIKHALTDLIFANGEAPFDGNLDNIILADMPMNGGDVETLWGRQKAGPGTDTFGLTDNTIFIPNLIVEGQKEGDGSPQLEVELEAVQGGVSGEELLFKLKSLFLKPTSQ